MRSLHRKEEKEEEEKPQTSNQEYYLCYVFLIALSCWGDKDASHASLGFLLTLFFFSEND